mmetsp:Transcript_2041/g.1863  ORF Transcript_2041/g.1863 Transcript_2041/m.1863 type:complete len:207 (+) Transcript_2041:703-1323(+)
MIYIEDLFIIRAQDLVFLEGLRELGILGKIDKLGCAIKLDLTHKHLKLDGVGIKTLNILLDGLLCLAFAATFAFFLSLSSFHLLSSGIIAVGQGSRQHDGPSIFGQFLKGLLLCFSSLFIFFINQSIPVSLSQGHNTTSLIFLFFVIVVFFISILIIIIFTNLVFLSVQTSIFITEAYKVCIKLFLIILIDIIALGLILIVSIDIG